MKTKTIHHVFNETTVNCLKCAFLSIVLCIYLQLPSCDGLDNNMAPQKTRRLEVSKKSNVTNNSNLLLLGLAGKFSARLREITDNDLGGSLIQDVVNSFEYKAAPENNIKYVEEVSDKLNKKLSRYLNQLNRSVEIIQEFKQTSKKLCFNNIPCFNISENGSYNEPNTSQNHNLHNLPLSMLNLTESFTSHLDSGLNHNLQYFISELESDRETHVFRQHYKGGDWILVDEPHFQKVFLKTASLEPRNLVLLIDSGVALSSVQFANAKSLASHIVLSLSEGDRVAAIRVADTTSTVTTLIHCSNDTNQAMLFATDNNKHLILAFIDDLVQSKNQTNHSLGFSQVFETIKESMKNDSSPVVVVYISRGLLSSIEEAKVVMEVISRGQDSVLPTVIINTCVLIDDLKGLMYEKHFLNNVAQQDFSMYQIKSTKSEMGKIVAGTMVSVNASSNMGSIVRTVCSHPLNKLNVRPEFFMPTWDVVKREGLVVTIAQSAKDKDGNLLGVFGIDIPLEDLAEDFIFYSNSKTQYAFLMNNDGRAVVHPLLKQPTSLLYEQPIALDITNFETSKAFFRIRSVIFQNSSGIWKTKSDEMTATFSWQHVPLTPYIVVSVRKGQARTVVWSSVGPSSPTFLSSFIDLVYHRLDLLDPIKYNFCRNFRQLSSLDTGSLFLSPWCFQSPYKYMSSEQNISQLSVQSYMAYIKDSTTLLANPGLRTGVRTEILSAVHVIPHWKKLYLTSDLSNYIVRKYLVTNSGAVIMYPGGVVDHNLDVLRRSWYLRAIQHPNQVTVIPPYLDSAGAGYVVTVSISVGQDPLSYVLAADFTLGAMFYLMMQSIPSCSSTLEENPGNVKCFLMDDRGYLIAHPSLLKGAADEQQHITHKESLLANDLLNHKGLVKKLVCNEFTSNSVERFYQFNLSLDRVVTNMISGEQCVRYQLSHLPGTNVFLGVVNTTCNLVTAFCPCNTIDRHCLNCNRMEQNECECPCECPATSSGQCEGDVGDTGDTGDMGDAPPPLTLPCTPVAEPTLKIPTPVLSLLPSVKPCRQFSCNLLITHKTCLGVIGCEWCQLQADGSSPLPTPFCASQVYCYNGVLGSRVDHPLRPLNGDTKSEVPMGSMGGVLFAVTISIALMCYCYCKNNMRSNHTHMVPVSALRLYSMEHSHPTPDDPPTGVSNRLVSNAQELSVALLSPNAAVSPYWVSGSYRRPGAGDSDPGYSTMTQHEDTEPHAPTPPPNATPPDPSHTRLPNNHILAAVTVHMPMDV